MLYITNTFFEWELEGRVSDSLRDALCSSPVCRQLQYLPLLFLEEKDTLLVTELPSQEDLGHLHTYGIKKIPRLCLLEKPEEGPLYSWGASRIIGAWANQHSLSYDMPSLDVVRRVNSKLWNFDRSPHLEGAKIVKSEEELKLALKGLQGSWVLKTDQGFAGTGHCIFDKSTWARAVSFSQKKAWNHGQGLLLEPWVNRILDFSSQWDISPQGDIQLRGVTKFFNTPFGHYVGTEVGPLKSIFGPSESFVQKHLEFCVNYLPNIVKEGFFGSLGVDSMIYICSKTGKHVLHPLVEVNARMTMSSAVLRFWQRYCPEQVVHFSFNEVIAPTLGLLPSGFKRQLIAKIK